VLWACSTAHGKLMVRIVGHATWTWRCGCGNLLIGAVTPNRCRYACPLDGHCVDTQKPSQPVMWPLATGQSTKSQTWPNLQLSLRRLTGWLPHTNMSLIRPLYSQDQMKLKVHLAATAITCL